MLTLVKKYPVELALLVFIVALVGLRFVQLNSDPPLYFIGHGQALLTDPYHLTHHARNYTLHDDSHPFDIHRWDSFKNSLVSAVSYITFGLFGVSRVSANLSAVLLNLGGLALFVIALARVRGIREGLIAGALLSANNLLFFYGRAPFLESGLVFFSGLLFYLLILRGQTTVGQIACGVVIALAALAGKLFGALLLAPACVTLFYTYRKKSLWPLARLLGGFAGGIGLYALVFYGGDMGVVLSYYTEQTVGMYGAPPGLQSVSGFFKMLLTFGGESGFYEYQPFMLALIGLGSVLLILNAKKKLEFDASYVPVVFCISWLFIGIVAMSPFYYRPLRYSLFFILPMAAIAAAPLAYSLKDSMRLQLVHKWFVPPLLLFIVWHLTIQGIELFAPFGKKFSTGVDSLSLGATVAVGVVALMSAYFLKARKLKSGRVVVMAAVLLAVGVAGAQGNYLYRGLGKPAHHLSDYNQSLKEILGKDAVIAGPYAPALTIDNEFRSVIYMFGLSNIETDLFEKYPITHIVVDHANFQKALKQFPRLEGKEILAEMVVRDETIRLYRVVGDDYPRTDYERAIELFNINKVDSAYLMLDEFLEEHPTNLPARMKHIISGLRSGRLKETIAEVVSLDKNNQEHDVIQGYVYFVYQLIAKITSDKRYNDLSRAAFVRSTALNPKLPKMSLTRNK